MTALPAGAYIMSVRVCAELTSSQWLYHVSRECSHHTTESRRALQDTG